MTRDMDLARKLLLMIEAHPSPDGPLQQVHVDGYDDQVVSYHIKQLHQAGYIEAQDLSAQECLWFPGALTWRGHEFLDAVRNDTVWEKTKAAVKDKGGSVPFDVLKDLATSFLRSLFGL